MNYLANRGSNKLLSCAKIFMKGVKMKYKNYYNYKIFENGDVYSNFTKKFLKTDINNGYASVTLFINKKPFRIKVHRLVALLWLDENKENKPTINHKDGNKLNNHYTNLEYATYYENNKHARDNNLNNVSKSNSNRWKIKEFREKTSKNISQGIINSGKMKGIKNPNAKYIITDVNNKIYTRQELSKIINRSLSFTDEKIRQAYNGKKIELFEKHNIIIKGLKS